jgi:hypothetical protein
MMNEDNYLLVGSEDLSREFNDVASYYSDFHKDVYGFRPRQLALCACDYSNRADLERALKIVKGLLNDVETDSVAVFEQERIESERAIAAFETAVATSIKLGAGDRATAIRWMCDANGVQNQPGFCGWEELEYEMGIPYGYVQKSVVV